MNLGSCGSGTELARELHGRPPTSSTHRLVRGADSEPGHYAVRPDLHRPGGRALDCVQGSR